MVYAMFTRAELYANFGRRSQARMKTKKREAMLMCRSNPTRFETRHGLYRKERGFARVKPFCSPQGGDQHTLEPAWL